jgi:hypothetical protein
VARHFEVGRLGAYAASSALRNAATFTRWGLPTAQPPTGEDHESKERTYFRRLGLSHKPVRYSGEQSRMRASFGMVAKRRNMSKVLRLRFRRQGPGLGKDGVLGRPRGWRAGGAHRSVLLWARQKLQNVDIGHVTRGSDKARWCLVDLPPAALSVSGRAEARPATAALQGQRLGRAIGVPAGRLRFGRASTAPARRPAGRCASDLAVTGLPDRRSLASRLGLH